jgi:hypothetical protein
MTATANEDTPALSLTTGDLDAAVAAGVIEAAQADALRAFAASRAAAPLPYDSEDERFRFMRGFNDFFFAIGVALLGAGLIFYLGGAVAGARDPVLPVAIWGAGAAICWVLSELLIRRMRLVLPGILLSGLFLIFVFLATPMVNIIGYFQIPPQAGSHSVLAQFRGFDLAVFPLKALVATIALLLFYARFRLPFALLLIAGSLIVGVMAMAALFLPPDMSGTLSDTAILLVCGLVTFAVAMRFDLSDRLRVTRRADCAFWLHLLAAPLIVHSAVTITFFSLVAAGDPRRFDETTSALAGATTGIIILLALVAIVVDRRALLVSALTYLGAIVGFAITKAVGKDTNVFYATLLVLGIFVLLIGTGWRTVRGAIMRLLPRALADRLPPVTIGS